MNDAPHSEGPGCAEAESYVQQARDWQQANPSDMRHHSARLFSQQAHNWRQAAQALVYARTQGSTGKAVESVPPPELMDAIQVELLKVLEDLLQGLSEASDDRARVEYLIKEWTRATQTVSSYVDFATRYLAPKRQRTGDG